MADITAKVLVVGGGPGGYVAAIRAGQLGLDTVLVEQGGGRRAGRHLPQCRLHPVEGADPRRRRLRARRRQRESAPLGIRVERPTIDFARTIEWKDGIVGRLTSGVGALLKRHRVKIVQGHAEMVDGKTCRVETDTGPQVVRAEHVVLATGSVPAALPALPFGGRVISSTEALSLAEVPERLAVVGAGYIGLELGMAYRQARRQGDGGRGADRILPLYDAELIRPVARRLQALGVEVLTGTRAAACQAMAWWSKGRDRAASRPTRSSSPPAGAPGSTASASSGSTSP